MDAVKILKAFLLLCLISAGSAYGMEITLMEHAHVEGENIYLKDIAVLRNAKGLESIVVGRSPYPGETREISKDMIRARLRQALQGQEIDLQGPMVVKVERACRLISPEEIAQIVERELKLRLEGVNILAVRAISLTNPVAVPTGPVQHVVEFPNLGGARGQIPVSILFYQGETFRKKLMITAQVSALGQVVVARGNYQRGKVLKVEDLELVTRDLNELPRDAIRSLEEAKGRVLRRSLNIGEVVRSTALEEPVVVKKGQTVTIVVENERLRITAIGTAQENGTLGDTIKVANIDSKKIIQAKVIDKDTVRVEF